MTATGDVTIKGWCPASLRPMQSGDGLIVRLKISGAIVDLTLSKQIARWSRRWGNGQIDLSSRTNLQLRGLAAKHLPDLHAALAEAGLLDDSAAAEAVRNVISSPLAGLDPDAVIDVRPIAASIGQSLANDVMLHRLPGKFGIVVDDGGPFGLDDVSADIRFIAGHAPQGPVFGIKLAGAPGELLGPCRPNEVPDLAKALSLVFLHRRKGRDAAIRRMRDLVAADGVAAIARQAGLRTAPAPAAQRMAHPSSFLGAHKLGAGAFVGFGLPFGRITANQLFDLAFVAAANGAREFRLTPWRAILVPVPSIAAGSALSIQSAAQLETASLILDPADPRRRVAACTGAPACPRATLPVRADASTLAAAIASAAGCGIMVHLSGCEKGCAHPYPAPVTLVGRNGRYDLVRDGVPSDPPALRNLTFDQVAEQLHPIMARRLQAGAA